jgi:zinc transport system substrate-binding protein
MVGRRGWILLGTLILASCMLGCLAPEGDQTGEGKIGVIVSIAPQAEFVERVGGDHVRVTVMVPPGASPHTYEPTAGQLRAVSNAQLYALVGSGIEFERVWFDKIRAVNHEMLVVDCSRGIALIGDEHDRAEGVVEEHSGADPHIWLSPRNAMVMVTNICDGLSTIDPEHEAEYIANRDRYLQELEEVDAFIHEQLDPYGKYRAFLTYHPSFAYFAAEYNLTQIAIEHGGKAPTPQVIQDSIDYAEQYNLSYVYVAPQFATRDAETIAHEINGAIIYLDPLPREYSATMRNIATSLARELE